MNGTTLYAATAATAFGVAVAGTPLVIALAKSRGWVAHPRPDRWGTRTVAVMGGIGIVVAILVASLAAAPVRTSASGFLLLAILALHLLGAVDDRIHINPLPKLVVEVGVAALAWWIGGRFGAHWPVVAVLPLTMIWVIGVTNAVNLLDNMDGLSSGVVAVSTAIAALVLATQGDVVGAVMATATAAACAGFLLYNVNPARVFMGDCGSLVLGFLVAWLALRAGQAAAPLLPAGTTPILAIGLAAVPILDTTVVTIARLREGRPVSQGGRDHLSHRLVFLGLSERSAVAVLWGLAVVAATPAWLTLVAPEAALWAALVVAVALVAFGLRMLAVPTPSRPVAPAAPPAEVPPSGVAPAGDTVASGSPPVADALPRRAVVTSR
ncbi:MAG: glycosyltransferase family 4 protein [Gemmatimonadota bacterium]